MLIQATSNHNLNLFSETNYKKQTHIWFSFYIQLRYCNLILKNYWTWAWKNSDYLTGLGLTLWYIRLGLEKYSNYLIALGLILWYIELGREKCSDYLNGVRFLLKYNGPRLTWTWTTLLVWDWFCYKFELDWRNELTKRDATRNVWRLSWILC